MILILSQNGLEESTNDVIDWLNYYKANFLRVNGEDLLKSEYYLEIHNDQKPLLNFGCSPKEVNVVWYRRWGDFKEYSPLKIDNDPNFEKSINTYLNGEHRGLSYAFFNMFSNAYWLSEPTNRKKDDKIHFLKKAQSVGLKIPKTYIVSTKKRLSELLKRNSKKYITKSIFNASKIVTNDDMYVQYTQELNNDVLLGMPEKFFPSLIQEKIEKEYEIRTFYLDGYFYSMAIFSQNDDQTKIDFRKYNFDKPNRNVPFKLPTIIENKLSDLMEKLGLITGSIDIIRDIRGDYFFLEVNPVGQFGMVSFPCNENIEKRIAQFLIKKDNERK